MSRIVIAGKKPCDTCPFRKDKFFYLPPLRVRGIIESITKKGEAFVCHKTVDYSGEFLGVGKDTKHCVGALIFLVKQGVSNQWMQVAQRLGLWNPETDLDDSIEVYKNEHEWLETIARKMREV